MIAPKSKAVMAGKKSDSFTTKLFNVAKTNAKAFTQKKSE